MTLIVENTSCCCAADVLVHGGHMDDVLAWRMEGEAYEPDTDGEDGSDEDGEQVGASNTPQRVLASSFSPLKCAAASLLRTVLHDLARQCISLSPVSLKCDNHVPVPAAPKHRFRPCR